MNSLLLTLRMQFQHLDAMLSWLVASSITKYQLPSSKHRVATAPRCFVYKYCYLNGFLKVDLSPGCFTK